MLFMKIILKVKTDKSRFLKVHAVFLNLCKQMNIIKNDIGNKPRWRDKKFKQRVGG